MGIETEVSTRVIDMTPDHAKRILAKTGLQRRLNQLHVDCIAQDMRDERFVLNGAPIVLGADGSCSDGQHRLAACVQADVSFRTVLVCGLGGHDVFDTLDWNRKRSMADTLRMRDIKNAHDVATVLRSIWCHEHAQRPWDLYKKERASRAESTNGQPRTPTKQMLLASLKDHPGVSGCVRWANGNPKESRRLLSYARQAFCRYMFKKVDRQIGEDFTDRLASGLGLTENEPVARVRNRLIAESLRPVKVHPDFKLGMVIKAWNLTLEGRYCKSFVFNPVRYGYPKIAGI